jgi:hypothetical protein
MADKCLRLLLGEVRAKTLRILKSIPAAQVRWAPPGLQNTVLWHAGHAFVRLESLTMKSLSRPPQIPDGWYELFSGESRPGQVPADRWPPLYDVIQQLESQQERLGKLIARLSDEQLERPSPASSRRNVRSAILHALHDEACHCGEMHLLAKMQAPAGRHQC